MNSNQPIQRTYAHMIRLLAATAVIAVLNSCGGGSGGGGGGGTAPPPPPGAPPAPSPTSSSFTLIPGRANLSVEEQITFSPYGATDAVTWNSSDNSVATVDATGRVTALARGNAVISATTGSGDAAKTSTAVVRVWQTDGPGADPSAESLIEAARTAGRISAEQALLYGVLARFADERLPAEFQGPSDPNRAVSLRTVSGELSSLSSATQEILLPFLTAPIYAQSWFAQQFGTGAAPATAAPAAVRAASVNCSIAEYPLPVARRATANFKMHAIVASPFSGEEIMLDYIASVIESIYGAQTGLLNRSATGDADRACNGGDGAIDVYLSPSPGNEDWAVTVPYPGACEKTPAYIVINTAKFPPWTGLDADQLGAMQRVLRTVLAHELLHVIQYGMDRAAACADYDWIDEATAQWVSDYVFEHDNQEDGFRKLGLANAYRTGVYYVDYLKGGHRESIESTNKYTSYIFFQFMAHKYKATSIKALFDAWESHGSVASINVALKAAGTTMPDAWSEFGKVLWNDIRESVLTDLNAFDNYDFGMANVEKGKPVALDGNGRVTINILEATGNSMAPRSLAYKRLVFTDAVAGVLLSNPFEAVPESEALKVIAVAKIGGQWRAPEDWTHEHTKSFCRDKRDERLEELLLIVSNGDQNPNAAPVSVPNDLLFAVSASNVGCWKWQGTATEQSTSHRVDSGRETHQEDTARATDLVFEASSETQGGTRLFTVASGNVSGLGTWSVTNPSCHSTTTGPTTAVAPLGPDDFGELWLNLDLAHITTPVPDRRVLLMLGITYIDSTHVYVCNGQTTTSQPNVGWGWLGFSAATHSLSVSPDGRSIEATIETDIPDGKTVNTLKFTAMRE